jgi:hypothetical protein
MTGYQNRIAFRTFGAANSGGGTWYELWHTGNLTGNQTAHWHDAYLPTSGGTIYGPLTVSSTLISGGDFKFGAGNMSRRPNSMRYSIVDGPATVANTTAVSMLSGLSSTGRQFPANTLSPGDKITAEMVIDGTNGSYVGFYINNSYFEIYVSTVAILIKFVFVINSTGPTAQAHCYAYHKDDLQGYVGALNVSFPSTASSLLDVRVRSTNGVQSTWSLRWLTIDYASAA